GAEPQQRLFHRTHRAVIGIIDHRAVRLPTDKAGTIAAPVKRVHPATDFGADHNVLARHTPDHRPAAMFRPAMAIKWGCGEQIDAQRERPLYRGNGGVVIQLRVEIAQRRSSEPERRDLKPRTTKCTARHYRHRDHIGLSSGLWPAQSKTRRSAL